MICGFMQTHLHSGQFRSTPTPMDCRFSELISYERSNVSTRVSPTKHEILCIKSLRLFTGKRDHTWRPKSSLWLNKTNMRSRCRSLTSTESALRTLPPPPTNDYGLSKGLKVPAASPNTSVQRKFLQLETPEWIIPPSEFHRGDSLELFALV